MSDQHQPIRTRTISWEDPALALQKGRSMDGLHYLKALQSGELPPPPLAQLIGLRMTEVSEGRVVFAIEPVEYHYNTFGTVHGGVTATLLDTTLGCTVQSMLPAGVGYTTLEINVSYFRPLTSQTGIVSCEGRILHMGSRIAHAEASVIDVAGRSYAHGTGIYFIQRP